MSGLQIVLGSNAASSAGVATEEAHACTTVAAVPGRGESRHGQVLVVGPMPSALG
jgi:hypothetical protein